MTVGRPAALAALYAVGLAGATGSAWAEGGPIRGGEHDDFSRIVMVVDPMTEWSLETEDGRAELAFPGKVLDFSTGGTFEKLPRSRITSVEVDTVNGGTVVRVLVGCACRISTAFVGAQYLALDVADRTPAPLQAPAKPVAEPETVREARESGIVASAEQVLLRQIEQAATQGLVRLTGDENAAAPPPPILPSPTVTEASQQPKGPTLPSAAGATPVAEKLATAAPPAQLPVLQALAEIEQVEARTVFGRDGALAAARLAEQALPPECLADAALDIGTWSDGAPLFAAMPALAARLVGEFDAPDADAVRSLARLYLRFGFTAEASALLRAFPGVTDEALLLDVAAVMDGLAATGPMAVVAPCPGAHGLWQILAGGDPDAPERLNSAHAAFAALPADLRSDLGPIAVGRLLDAGLPEAARRFQDTAARDGQPASEVQRLAAARLAATEGNTDVAIAELAALVDGGATNAEPALRLLTQIAVEAGIPMPERMITDLRTTLMARRDPSIRAMLAEALATRGEVAAAMHELDQARAEAPEAGFERILTRILASADPDHVGAAVYAEAVLARVSVIDQGPARDDARRVIAGRLIELGLPEAALDTLGPPVDRGEPAARLLAAEAEIRMVRTQGAIATLAGLAGPEAARLRARAWAADGDFSAAAAALEAAGLETEAGAYAWAAGDWPTVSALAPDANRTAMARFMSPTDPVAVAADDAADLDGIAAFIEPLPSLAVPSLSAAHRLMATSRQIGDIVEEVLLER